MRTAARRAVAPRRPRGRVDPHHPRGRGRVRAPGAAVLGGKDSIVMLRLAEKAFWPAPHPVPGDARRHRPQLPRGPRVPRPRGSPSSALRLVVASVQESIDAGRVVEETGPRASRNRLQTVDAARRDRGARLRRRVRRRPARRGEGPGQGAGVLASATSSGSGTRRTSGPSCGTSTTAATARASTSACSRSRTGPSSTSGSTSPTRRSRSRRSTSPTGARCSGATACCWRVTEFVTLLDGEEPFETHGALPHGRRRDLHRRGRVAGRDRRGGRSPRSPPPRITERGATRADDRFSEAAMEDRKREGYF